MSQKIHILPSGKKIKPLSTPLAIVLVLLLSLVMFLNGYAFAGWYFSFDYAHEFMELLYLPVYTTIIFLPALLKLSFFVVKKDSEYWGKKDFSGLYRFIYKFMFVFCLGCSCVPVFFTAIIYNSSTIQKVSTQVVDKRWYYVRNNPEGVRRNWLRVDPSFTEGGKQRIEVQVNTEKFKSVKLGDIVSFYILKNDIGLILMPRSKALEID